MKSLSLKKIVKILMVGSVLIGQLVYADAKERLEVEYQSGREQQVELKKETFETRYRYEEVQDTCSEQVFSHNTTICSLALTSSDLLKSNQKRRICTRENGRTVCRDDGSSSGGGSSGGGYSGGYSGGGGWDGGYTSPTTCYSQPVYETRYYSCTRTISIPYQVHLYTTHHQVKVNFALIPPMVGQLNPKLVLSSKSNGDLVLTGSGLREGETTSAVIILGELEEVDEREVLASAGNPKYLRKWTAKARFADTKQVFKLLTEASNKLDIVNGKAELRLGDMAKKEDLTVSVTLKKDRFLLSDKTILSRELEDSEYDLEEVSDGALLDFPLKSLTKWKRGRYILSLTLKLRQRDDILNLSEMPSFTKVVTQKMRLRKKGYSERK